MRTQLLRFFILVILISAIVTVSFNFRDQLQLDQLQHFLDEFGFWAPIIFMLIYIIATVLFLPGAILTIAGGFLFGPIEGTAYSLMGAVIGATFAFLIARYVAKDWVKQKMGVRLNSLVDGVAAEGWRFVAVVRLVPMFPFNLSNYALGLTGVNLLAFILASSVFMLPGAAAYAYIGSLGHAAIGGDTQVLITRVFIVIGLVVLLSIMPWLVKLWRKSRKVQT